MTNNNKATEENARPSNNLDTGLMCLLMLARFHHVIVSAEQLKHEYLQSGKVFDQNNLVLAARSLKLKAKVIKISVGRLVYCPLPAIASDLNGRFFIILKVQDNQIQIYDPLIQKPQIITLEALQARWNNGLMLLTTQAMLVAELARFDFSWFIPAIVKYRKLLGEALVISFVLQLFALIMPLFFQVIMDKVLVHRGLGTLDVIAIGLLAVMLFETVLSGLRSYVFAHTASRIDVELGSRLFRHLLSLPLSWFQARRVGDSVARVRELENIRSFLTGNAITLLLDVLFSVVFISVMIFYSFWLTLVVIISLPLYFIISLFITPLLRARLQESFNRDAENQAFLVETINGMDTLKAAAVEPHIGRRWDNQLAAYVLSSFKTQTLSILATESVGLIGKMVTVATLWLGARLVIEGKLSVGQLIAFNMLAGRVSQPIMRLAQLWANFQQTGVSVQRLGDILNSPTETANNSASHLPVLQGHIAFDEVYFRYRPDGKNIITGLSLEIKSGQTIGIVGRSGSGKSTLTKLIQRLHVPERGRILVDGMNLAVADVRSLRRQIGVVLQDNMLFNCSIRENIALTDPGVSIEKIMHAAQLAAAHEFILELPQGYDTVVGEHGASLSGGQRQRIAIARALIGNPRILIFDEATSALDYESESLIQHNMQAICQGRTVIIIAHRLSAVRHAQKIVVMDRGCIVESGTHQALLNNKNGHYWHLYQLQQSAI